MTDQKITVNEQAGQFQLKLEQGLAFIDYELGGNTISILHTEVPEELEGQGIASHLAKFALNFARENQLKVKNHCRFVQVFLQHNPEYQDLIIRSNQ